MGEVERNNLVYYCTKVGNDPDLLAEDAYGKKIPLDANPKPVAFKTFCNILAQRVCRAMGYDKLDDLTANQMHDWCEANWFKTTEDGAVAAANAGDLALAIWRNPECPKLSEDYTHHGHVAVVFPGKPIFSGKWNRYAPLVAAVDLPIPSGANYSFGKDRMPDYFRLGRETS